MTEAWATVEAELDRAFDTGRTIQIWLRDDDCVAVTPALERLDALCRRLDLPILLAVIPEPAEPDLAGWIAGHPAVTPCQHGFAHRNHAASGERARELGGLRPAEAVLDELARGRAKLQALFGGRLSDILVPPWNRIDADLVPRLPGLGYAALSTFGPQEAGGIRRLNSDLDIIDWRNGRVGRPLDDLARKLAGLLHPTPGSLRAVPDRVAPTPSSWPGLSRPPTPSGGTDTSEQAAGVLDRYVGVGGRDKPGHDAALSNPIRSASQTLGILTHHLVHDATAWAALEEMLERLRSHPAVAFTDAGSLLQPTRGTYPPTRAERP